jgi:hypothetical protein
MPAVNIFVGLDLEDEFSIVLILDEKGEVIEENPTPSINRTLPGQVVKGIAVCGCNYT